MARVLLVEDDDGLQRFLCDVLEQEAHTAECVCVRTKAEAEAALRAGRYELVIADVRLPDGSGRDLAALARAAGAKVLLTSGHPAEITLLQVSAVEHLSKPFRVSDLLALLRRHLGP